MTMATRSESRPPQGAQAHHDVTNEEARLLRAVQEIAPLISGCAAQADREGRLAEAVVTALRSHGFWRMRLCREAGGLELPITAQIAVLAALAAEDSASAWCTMVVNTAVAVIGATMPQAAVDHLFAEGVPACTIVATPGGTATPAEGGYILNGSWRLAGAIHHAGWVHGCALIDRDPSRLLPFVVPVEAVTLLDSWNVVGLAGTGSNDFTLTDHFLSAKLAGREYQPFGQVRGQRRYDRVDVAVIDSYQHLAFAIGVARRALRELRIILGSPPVGRPIGDRELVQEQFGRAVVRLQAVEALAFSLYDRIDAAALGQAQHWYDDERHLPRVLAAQASELALECVQLAFRRSGLAALHQPNIFDKLLRDMNVAANHMVVDDVAYAAYGQHLVESHHVFGFRHRVPSNEWER